MEYSSNSRLQIMLFITFDAVGFIFVISSLDDVKTGEVEGQADFACNSH